MNNGKCHIAHDSLWPIWIQKFRSFFLGFHNVPAKKHQEQNKQLQHLQDISMSSMSLFRCLGVDLWKTPWVIWFSGCNHWRLNIQHRTTIEVYGWWLLHTLCFEVMMLCVGSVPYLCEFVGADMIQLLQVAPRRKTQRDWLVSIDNLNLIRIVN